MILNEPIVGRRLMLKSLSDADIGQTYVNWLNDPEVTCFLETRHSKQDLATIRDFVYCMNDLLDQLLLGIFADGHQHIGNIKIGPINSIHRFADISLFIGDKAFWGHGYGKEAVTMLSLYAFEKLNLYKIYAWIYEENVASRRLFLRVGYKQEGFFQNHYINNKGQRTGALRMSLFVDSTLRKQND